MSLNEQQVKYPESYYNPNEHPLKDLITPTSYKKGNLIKVSAYDTARVRDFFCQVGAVVSRQQIQVIVQSIHSFTLPLPGLPELIGTFWLIGAAIRTSIIPYTWSSTITM